ncbi:MAG: C39 family peptidase [Acidobacteria bacterium]|nr:C39 family peptidase [Acidobacteriota bacterium]
MTRLHAAAAVLVLAAASVLAGAAVAAPDAPVPAGQPPAPTARLLDVPYLPQSEDLCGGAALAMVLRYWGARQVFAEDFAPLVDRSRAGIVTTALTAEARRRGWTPITVTGAAGGDAWLDAQIAQARPVIALIAVGPERFHYVVVTARTATHVVFHDPAVGPYRVLAHAEFARAWHAADRWASAILPAAARLERSDPDDTSLVPAPGIDARIEPGDARATSSASAPCDALVAEMVTLARAGRLEPAAAGLTTATALCPGSAAAWQELAGLRFVQSQWEGAGRAAARAAAIAPDDAAVWDLLATSRFLAGQPAAALTAWNHIGRPRLDGLRVSGAARTRQPVIAALVGLPPRDLLTAAAFARAARRLAELPSAALTRLSYQPLAGGLAHADAVVLERPRLPRGAVPLAALGARAAVHRELAVDVASPTGSGELWSGQWRFWDERPRLAFMLAVPSRAGLPGVTTIEGAWERQAYAAPSGTATSGIAHTERLRAAVGLSDWLTSGTRWSAAAALDRWDDTRHLMLAAALDQRLAADHVAVGADAAGWAGAGGGPAFARTALSVAARSSTQAGGAVWSLRAGIVRATRAAPLDLWAGAGTGHGRAPLLRAHPLLDGGVITGAAFGRRLAHATVESAPALLTRSVATLRLAVFVDVARTGQRRAGDPDSAWQADVGTGLRLVLPGRAGTARVDVARGLRDGRTAVSAAWEAPWPGP